MSRISEIITNIVLVLVVKLKSHKKYKEAAAAAPLAPASFVHGDKKPIW